VPDPEIPVMSIVDLGIVRSVARDGDSVAVTVTPTYSGCPATELIATSIRESLARAGFPDARIDIVLSPAWSTDWIGEEGKRRLREFGIAPPGSAVRGTSSIDVRGISPLRRTGAVVPCPLFASLDRLTTRSSARPRARRTAAASCLEPFDYFKPTDVGASTACRSRSTARPATLSRSRGAQRCHALPRGRPAPHAQPTSTARTSAVFDLLSRDRRCASRSSARGGPSRVGQRAQGRRHSR
jgi:ring-1,2-phenylacetyl-CoA epoxidase subunit PaaD